MTYRGSSLRGEPTLCADYMRRWVWPPRRALQQLLPHRDTVVTQRVPYTIGCGRRAAQQLLPHRSPRDGCTVVRQRVPCTIAAQCHMHMHMHRSGQLRDVLRPKQGAAGDDSTGEGEDCAASSLHALHELWNVRDEHAAEVLTLTLTPTLTLTLTLTLVLTR